MAHATSGQYTALTGGLHGNHSKSNGSKTVRLHILSPIYNVLVISGVYSQCMHDYLIGSQICQVHGYMHEKLIGRPITMDNEV